MAAGEFQITVDGTPLAARLRSSLVELELRQADDAIGLLRLRFDLAQGADGTYPLIDDGLWEPGAEISLALAAPGGAIRRVFTGYLAYLRPHFEAIESNCYLDIVAHDPAVVLDAEERVASYPDASDSDIAAEILNRYDIDSRIADTDYRPSSDDRLQMQRGTDWAFLLQLARRNGFTVHFEADPNDGRPLCVFGPRPLDDAPQADLTILRENANLAWLDFEVAEAVATARAGAAIDPVSKRIVRADTASQASVLGGVLQSDAARSGLTRRGAGGAVRLLRGATPDDTALNVEAAGAMGTADMVVEARGELDPALYRNLLQPHRTVLVKGVGDRFSGNYYVAAVRTLMRDGELTQSFTATANALGRAGSERFGQSAEEEPAA